MKGEGAVKTSTKIMIAVTLALLIITGMAAFLLMRPDNEGKTAYIYQNDELIKTVDLSSVTESYEFTVISEDGGSNTVRVRSGSIGVVSADCPDGLCVGMGFIGAKGMPVVCLPNGLMIVVEGGEGDVDAKT